MRQIPREEMIMAHALSEKEGALLDAYWRAANGLVTFAALEERPRAA